MKPFINRLIPIALILGRIIIKVIKFLSAVILLAILAAWADKCF